MSFGFSIGDILAVAELVETVRKRFNGAPAEYTALADETRTLQIVVNDLKIQIEDDELEDAIKHDLQCALQHCQAVLRDLLAVINTNTEISSTATTARKLPRRMWKRIRWDPVEADKLRSRLISAVQLLDAIRRRLDRRVYDT